VFYFADFICVMMSCLRQIAVLSNVSCLVWFSILLSLFIQWIYKLILQLNMQCLIFWYWGVERVRNILIFQVF